MKKILAGLLIGAMLAVPASAEIQTYSDEYVTFQYDDEMIGEIKKTETGDPVFVRYSLNTIIEKSASEHNYATLLITTAPDVVDDLTKEIDQYDKSVLSEDPLQVLTKPKNGDGIETISTLVSTHDDQAAILSISTDSPESKNYEYCKIFADSVTLSELFDYEGYYFITKDIDRSIIINDIFNNKRYSEQAIIYAQKALDTCNQYLNMEISGEEAAKIFSELERRTDSYNDITEYTSDRDVYNAVFLHDTYFKNGKDAEVIEIRDELQEIIDCGVLD